MPVPVPLMDLYKHLHGERREGVRGASPGSPWGQPFLENLEKIRELRKWIPDPCNPHLHYLKQQDDDEK